MAPERGSDKHGAMLDDVMSEETEGLERSGHSTHAHEWREPEPSGEGQPHADLAPQGELVGGVPDGMTAADVEDRSRLASYVSGPGLFPATASDLVARAEESSAPDDVLAMLRRLPGGQEFASLQEVWSALGGGVEEHRS